MHDRGPHRHSPACEQLLCTEIGAQAAHELFPFPPNRVYCHLRPASDRRRRADYHALGHTALPREEGQMQMLRVWRQGCMHSALSPQTQ